MNKPSESSRAMEAEILWLLQATPGKKYRTTDLARHFKSTTNRMRTVAERLAGKRMISEHKDSRGRVYSSLEAAPIEEMRAFVQKPYVFPAGMVGRLKDAKEDREWLPSKTNAEDAGELSEMDRNKLRMMGSGN